MVTKVKLRSKPISGNRKSLYLDFYPPIDNPISNKKTRREFLGLYVFKKINNPIDKQHNKETVAIAEQIRQKRDNQLNKPEIYSDYQKEQLRVHEMGEKDFLTYFKKLMRDRDGSNLLSWQSTYKYLERFSGNQIKFNQLNEKFCEGFKNYLLKTKSIKSAKRNLSHNSALSYFNKFKAVLKQAYKDEYIRYDLDKKVKPIKEVETRRNYLTLEELNTLVKTECRNPMLKRAALFSALTGLRFSDIKKLIWSEIEYIEGQGYFVNFKQKKTKGIEYLPFSDQAFKLLGEQKGGSKQIFKNLIYSAYQNKFLAKWIEDAGIRKKITFHCFRHTYATLQLSNGTDIYTVSKMLGHKELKTTQIYAKIVDEKKRNAANNIKLTW